MRIYVHVSPRSSKNEVLKISANEYKIKLTTPPINGKANETLINLLADYFKVAKSRVTIVGGKSSKIKMIDVI